MTDLDQLCKIRGGHRAVTTKIIQEVDEILTSGSALAAEQFKQLSVKQQQLDGALRVLSDINKGILDKCNVETSEGEIDESEAVSVRILECKQRISEVIKSADVTPTAILTTPTISSTVSITSTKLKLPKLTLPRFRRDLTTWTTFWELYNSTMHDNNAISKVDKFSYLKSLLEGAAAKAIQGLTLSDANYDSAIDLLKERFGKPQAIITAHMEELLKIPSSTSDCSHSLRSVCDKIIIHV